MNIPLIELPASAFGPLGVTLDTTDNGGGNGQTARSVPVLAVNWMDERQTCVRVLSFVHHGQTPDLAACPQYRHGQCARGGACLFHEAADHPTWAKARTWQYDPATGYVVPQALWAKFGLLEREP
jgi:hypothetical protein